MTNWDEITSSFAKHVTLFNQLKAELDLLTYAQDVQSWSKTQHQRIWTLPMKMQVEIRCRALQQQNKLPTAINAEIFMRDSLDD